MENDPLLTRYVAAAHAAGVPADQLNNLVRAGVVLQPKQLVASAVARQMDADGGPVELGYGGSRGGGKTFWMLAQMGADDCQRYPGLKCLLLRKVGKALNEAFDDLRPRILGRIPHEYARSRGGLLFENGSRILLGNYKDEKDIEKYLGLEYDVIGVEEATTLSASKYQAIMSCLRTSKPGWRPRAYTTTNPGGLGHAWYKGRFIKPNRRGLDILPVAEQTGRTRFIPATVDDNVMVNREYRDTLDQFVGWQLRAWRFGDWDIAAGQFFTNFRADVHVVDMDDIPWGWRTWLAMDYGFTHYTVVYLFAQSGDGDVFILDEHAERRWLPERHAQAITEMLGRWGLQPHHPSTFVAGADVFAKRGDDGSCVADKYEALGYKLRPAKMDRQAGAALMLYRLGDVEGNSPIAPSLFINRRCAGLIECIPALEHNPTRPEDVLKWDTDENGEGGDDFYDAARYGLQEADRGNKLRVINYRKQQSKRRAHAR